MPCNDKPAGNSASERVLSATLQHVRGHHQRRRQFAAAAITLAIVAVGIPALWIFLPSESPAVLSNVGTTATPVPIPVPVPVAESKIETTAIVIERISAAGGESDRSSRIQRSSRLESIERLSHSTYSPQLIETITEGQLFAALPEDQPVALLKNPDGSSRLFLLQDSAEKR